MIGEVSTGSMGQVMIKATPERLFEKADAAAGRVQSMRKHFESIEQAVNRSSGYWIGWAGDAHRETYQENREEIDEALRRFQENAEDLKKIAQNYLTVIQETTAEAESLPDNVII